MCQFKQTPVAITYTIYIFRLLSMQYIDNHMKVAYIINRMANCVADSGYLVFKNHVWAQVQSRPQNSAVNT